MSMQATIPAKKNIYVVLGMARSGTSAIARGLNALGVELGDKLTTGSEKWNPKGFFEDDDIVYKINRRVLYAMDYTWMAVNVVENAAYKNSDIPKLKTMATDLLTKRIASTQHWGFKDPRTAKILPFWQDIFGELKLQDNYIIALRNPLASAHSYQRVTGTDIEVGLLLWIMHLMPAIEGTHGKKRMIVNYDAMMKNPHQQLERLQKGMNIPALAPASEIDKYANEFLDKKLRHYEYNDDDFKSHAATRIAPLSVKMYDLFLKLSRDEISFESEEFTLAWDDIKKDFQQAYPTYGYIDVLLRKNKSLERALRVIHKSWPWKLLYPLRFIDDALRARRRLQREKKRWLKSYG